MPQGPHAHGHTAAHHATPQHHAATQPQAPLWTVVRQEMDTRYIPGQTPVDEWIVYFQTRSGSQSYVRIPVTDYNATVVASAIQPLAEEMEKVAALHGNA